MAQLTPFQAPIPQQLSDEDVLAALRRIPIQFQEVIVLCDVEELTYKEIAEALAIPDRDRDVAAPPWPCVPEV